VSAVSAGCDRGFPTLKLGLKLAKKGRRPLTAGACCPLLNDNTETNHTYCQQTPVMGHTPLVFACMMLLLTHTQD
jgi:hypothetical protein